MYVTSSMLNESCAPKLLRSAMPWQLRQPFPALLPRAAAGPGFAAADPQSRGRLDLAGRATGGIAWPGAAGAQSLGTVKSVEHRSWVTLW